MVGFATFFLPVAVEAGVAFSEQRKEERKIVLMSSKFLNDRSPSSSVIRDKRPLGLH